MTARLAREPYCYLTTTGRRSGRARRIEIWFAARDGGPDVIYLLAGAGERAGWVRNLRADPRVTVEIGGRRFAGLARVVGAGAEDATARRLVYEKYRREDDLEEWRDSALPVAIELRHARRVQGQLDAVADAEPAARRAVPLHDEPDRIGAEPVTPREFDPATLDVATSEHYEQHGYPHAEWTWLRRNAPVFWYERSNVEPFWAVTKHADIVEISKQPELFLNQPRLAVFTLDLPPPPEGQVRHLLNMDPPDHARYRRLASGWFTPRAIRGMDEKVARVTREVLDDAARMAEGDFVREISARITIAVIAEMLGVPRPDWNRLFRWTNEIIAPQDPEFQRGDTPRDTIEAARLELFTYFNDLVERRRARPTDDIVSVVANGQVNDAPLGPVELLSYFFLLVVAGNETTRNAMTGGLLAFLEHPAEWEKLRANPALLDTAVEEAVRWTTPVIQFARTATRDYELRGKTVRKGQAVCLFYPSANRDEDVFPDPFAFRVDRDPNPHIAFGMGEHLCLGAHLARLELRHAFGQLRERLERCELAGPVERVRSSFVGGIKHVPMRWRIRAASL